MGKKLNIDELFSLMMIFEIGTALLFCLGIAAKQDAWLAVLLAMTAAFFLIFVFILLFNKTNMNLAQILEYAFGKYIGKILSLLYAFYFFYNAAKNTRDYTELSLNTITPKTPIYVFPLFMMLLVMYYLLFDISILGRVAKIILPIILIITLIQPLPVITKSDFSFTKLLPVMEGGILPVIKAAFPLILTFPFGELIAFTMVFTELKQKNKLLKYSILLVLLAGLLLSFNNIIIISALGIAEAERYNFPFYQVTTLISFGTLKNFDTFFVIIMVLGIFFKITVFTYAGLKALQNTFELNDYKSMLIPVATIITGASFVIADSYPTYIIIGLKITPLYIHVPLQIILPVLTLIAVSIKAKKKPA